jgi:hypothetical protein
MGRKSQPERAEEFAQFYAKGNDDLIYHSPAGPAAWTAIRDRQRFSRK